MDYAEPAGSTGGASDDSLDTSAWSSDDNDSHPSDESEGNRFDKKHQYTFPASGETQSHPFLRHNYDPSREDKLCRICRQIDFDHLLQRHRGWPGSILLGTAAELRARADNCVLCTFAVSAWPIHSATPKALDHHRIALVPSQGKTGRTLGLTQIWSSSHTAQLISFHRDASPVWRQVQSRYNPKLLCDWIRQCGAAEKNRPLHPHVAGNQTSAAAGGSLYAKRFIDVKEECVINTSSLSQVVEYAALSYVWGREPQKVLLTHDSANRLYQPESLSSIEELSKTIRDAITVCKDMNIPLLWVDALCIRQDGAPEQDQLGIMHLIYEKAAFTIVALAGKDAGHGLVGVSEDARGGAQFKLHVQGVQLLVEEPGLPFSLDTAYWSSRAWTYQEFLLSQRRIVFYENIIYYSCRHGIFREDRHDNGKHHGSKEGISYYDVNWSSANWYTYRDLVQAYTEKNLSYETDFLIAFGAMLGALKRSGFTDKFTFGLPVSHFDSALLWRRARPSNEEENHAARADAPRPKRARVILPQEVGQEGGLAEPPSWSWASFQGKVQYESGTPRLRRLKFLSDGSSEDMATIGGVLELEADVATFKLALPDSEDSEDGESPTYSDCDDDDDDDDDRGGDDDNDGDDDSDDVGNDDDNNDDHNDKDDDDDDGNDADDEKDNSRDDDDEENDNDQAEPIGLHSKSYLKIMESRSATESYRCGVVVEDDDWGEVPTEASFIKLSQCSLDVAESGPSEAEVAGPGKNRLGHLPREPEEYEEGFSFTREYDDKERLKDDDFMGHTIFDRNAYDWNKWPVYSVLMVAWRDDGVAVRLGVGKIHVDAFDNAETFDCKRFQLA